MAGNLRDQLIKAGLATNAQAKKIERQQRAESQARRHGEKKSKRTDQPTDQPTENKTPNHTSTRPSKLALKKQNAIEP